MYQRIGPLGLEATATRPSATSRADPDSGAPNEPRYRTRCIPHRARGAPAVAWPIELAPFTSAASAKTWQRNSYRR